MDNLESKEFYCYNKNDNYYVLYKRTGLIFELDQSGMNLLNLIVSSKSISEIIEKTKKYDDLVGIEETEIEEFIKYIKEQSSSNSNETNRRTFHLQWHLTGICNLKCKHCYQEEYSTKYDLNFEAQKKIVDNYFEFIDKYHMNPEISLTGGEPLTYEYLFKLMEYILSKHPETRLFLLTNGTLISEKIIEKLKKVNIMGVQISLDGYDDKTHDFIRGTGNFNKAINAIKLLKANGIYTTVHCVLMKNNIDYIEEYIKLCSELNTNRLTFSRFVPYGNGEKNKLEIFEPQKIKEIYYKIYELKDKYPKANVNLERDLWKLIDPICGSICPVGEGALTILNDGTVLPCRRLPIKIGNALEESVIEIMFKSKILDKMKNNNLNECEECSQKESCKGGCQGIAFAYFGELMKHPDPQCWNAFEVLPPVGIFDKNIRYNEVQGYYEFEEDKTNYKNVLIK